MRVADLLILGTCFQAFLVLVTAGLYPDGIQVNTISVPDLINVYKCSVNFYPNDPNTLPQQEYLRWWDMDMLREYLGAPYWFFGFAKKGSDMAIVGAFVPSREATIETPKNKPSQIREGIRWYYNNASYGFAPNSTINQNVVDTFDPTDPRRLSIFSKVFSDRLYRLGATPVSDESQYYSLFFLCDPSRTSPPTPAPTPSPTATTVPPTKRCGKEPTKCPTRKPTKNRCRPTRSPKPARE